MARVVRGDVGRDPATINPTLWLAYEDSGHYLLVWRGEENGYQRHLLLVESWTTNPRRCLYPLPFTLVGPRTSGLFPLERATE